MQESTSSHPSRDKPDATTQGEHPGTTATTAKLSSAKVRLKKGLRQYPDFPKPGVLFEDILPLFRDPLLHQTLIDALELQITNSFGRAQTPDIVVGLESRGFLFGPSLALKLGAGFVPVRKPGKLPGSTEKASFEKEYGEDHFEIQSDAITTGQKVLIIDDIIATGKKYSTRDPENATDGQIVGGSAAAAGSLVQKLGGDLIGYVFVLELDFLKGREKLDRPVQTLLSSQEGAS